MTAKQAVEALLVKEPNGETLRFLRKEGLLNQILHPERAAGYRERRPPQRAKDGALSASFGSEGAYKYASAVERQGREGGRSQRSIASAKTTNHNDDSNQAMENGGTSAPLSSSSSSSSSTPPPPPRVYNTRGAGVANPLAVETKTSENDVARVTSPSSAEVSTEMTGTQL